MGAIKLKDGVYSVGVINPGLRIFDIIMYAEYGTSYNAYIVKGEKTALIDTVHEGFFDEYKENLNSVTDIEKIDYLIVNHSEPDHSGSIREIVRLNPEITVISTAAAAKYISNIINMQFNSKVAKAGDVLDLGGKTLEFCPAPFLHWPDTMFTYVKEDGIAFTCDFLGTHYCEPRMYDRHIYYPESYEYSFKYYYDCIFGPFKPYVLQGLDKLSAFSPKIVCPSHGPILTDTLPTAVNKYKEWSTPAEKSGKTVFVAYASAYGYTKVMAMAAAETLQSKGFGVMIFDMVESPIDEMAQAINNCDAVLIGTNTINRDATKPVWNLLSSIDAINTGKPAGAFGSYGWSGEAVGMVKGRLESLRFKFFADGYRAQFKPTQDDLIKVGEYALDVASNIK